MSPCRVPTTDGAETAQKAKQQPRNAKPMEGKTESKKCCLNGRSWGIATIHLGNIFVS